MQTFTGKMAGALTFSFTQTVYKNPGLTYGHLLNAIRSSLRKNNPKNNLPDQVFCHFTHNFSVS